MGWGMARLCRPRRVQRRNVGRDAFLGVLCCARNYPDRDNAGALSPPEIPKDGRPGVVFVSNLRQSRRLEEGGAAQSRMALRAKLPLPNLSAVGAASL